MLSKRWLRTVGLISWGFGMVLLLTSCGGGGGGSTGVRIQASFIQSDGSQTPFNVTAAIYDPNPEPGLPGVMAVGFGSEGVSSEGAKIGFIIPRRTGTLYLNEAGDDVWVTLQTIVDYSAYDGYITINKVNDNIVSGNFDIFFRYSAGYYTTTVRVKGSFQIPVGRWAYINGRWTSY